MCVINGYYKYITLQNASVRDFLTIQWLRLVLPMQGAVSLIPGAKIPHGSQPKKKKNFFLKNTSV